MLLTGVTWNVAVVQGVQSPRVIFHSLPTVIQAPMDSLLIANVDSWHSLKSTAFCIAMPSHIMAIRMYQAHHDILANRTLSSIPADVAEQFVSAGGLYALFLLLHHEMAGGHHSKMAGSLVSLLNLVLDTGLDVQVSEACLLVQLPFFDVRTTSNRYLCGKGVQRTWLAGLLGKCAQQCFIVTVISSHLIMGNHFFQFQM